MSDCKAYLTEVKTKKSLLHRHRKLLTFLRPKHTWRAPYMLSSVFQGTLLPTVVIYSHKLFITLTTDVNLPVGTCYSPSSRRMSQQPGENVNKLFFIRHRCLT